jgi:hypothetical protein
VDDTVATPSIKGAAPRNAPSTKSVTIPVMGLDEVKVTRSPKSDGAGPATRARVEVPTVITVDVELPKRASPP